MSNKAPKKAFHKTKRFIEAKYIIGKKDSEMYFNGGSSVDWFKAKKKIEAAFREGEVWDLVEIPSTLIPDEDGEYPEVKFELVEPNYNELVEDKMEAWVQKIDGRLAAEENDINNSFAPGAARNAELFRARSNHRDAMTKEDERLGEYKREYMTLKKIYDKEKKEWDSKVAKCLSIFRKRINTVGLNPVEEQLRQYKFRNVWNKLNQFFQATNSGREGQSSIMKMAANIVWNGYNLYEHMEQMTALFSQCEDIGYPINEDLRYDYLTESITKSSKCPKPYLDLIHHYNNMPTKTSYQQLINALQMKYNSMSVAKQLKHSMETAHNHSSSSNVQVNTSSVDDGSKKKDNNNNNNSNNSVKHSDTVYVAGTGSDGSTKVCSHCGKEGHVKSSCWLLKTCSICGKKGHISRYCPENKNEEIEETYTAQKPSQDNKKQKKEKDKEVNPQSTFRNKYPTKG